jgi:hypothetical protein
MSSRMLISFQQTLPVKYFKALPRLKLEPPVVCYNTDYFIQPYVSLVYHLRQICPLLVSALNMTMVASLYNYP